MDFEIWNTADENNGKGAGSCAKANLNGNNGKRRKGCRYVSSLRECTWGDGRR